ncbi:conjugal transfer protein TrbL [Nocardiopsis mwathae]|nr:conjugal transfer protein TrbL [Nocardiopsis mwathae]
MALLVLAFVLVPMGGAQANPVCEGEPAPQPEAAGSGADGLLVPPQSQSSIVGSPDGLPPDASLYGQYGTAGQQWHVIRESCVDKMGSAAVATLTTTTWELSKTINQSTITVYQAATSDGLLSDFNTVVESFIRELREGIWRPLLPTVIILGAVWLGWYGLIRKRLTLTVESAVWMVLATAMGIWILVNPGQVLGMAGNVVNSGGQLVNAAFSKMSFPGASGTCPGGAEPVEKAEWESENDFAVRQNSNMLWSSLVCEPWVAGVFGTGDVADSAATLYGTDLIAAQGISRIEQQRIADGEVDGQELVAEKQERYEEIAEGIQTTYPGVYPLFEGSQQENRLGIAVLALFAALFAGGLILAGSVALIVLKIGFLLLLLLSPVFLLIGIHPGYGRTVLLRWFEMVLGILLKQVFVVLLIALLVMCYGIIMATNLAWGLQMILLALFTLALFIYRKPFAHLFASVNANTFTSRMVSDAVSSSALSKSANVLPPVAYMRAQKWGLKRSPQIAAAATALPAGTGAAGGTDAADTARGAAAAGGDAAEGEGTNVRADTDRVRGTAGYGRVRGKAAPPPLDLAGKSGDGDSGRSQQGAAGHRSSAQAPRLSEAASGGLPPRGSGGRSGPIPPRPSGGYTGTGDTGWASVFGTDSGGGQRAASSGGGGGGGSSSGGADQAAPSTGQGIFRGRSATPPQGNPSPRGSRWGGPSTRKEKSAPPPRPPRPASAPSARREDGGSWITGSGKKSGDAPTSPFWTGSSAQRQRENKRDIPFWLRDEDG